MNNKLSLEIYVY